jgi:hypothetical protein
MACTRIELRTNGLRSKPHTGKALAKICLLL